MPYTPVQRDALFRGLSDFWRRLFQDVDDLRALYAGIEVVLGQHYLNLLSDALNPAVIETPLFKKEYYTDITITQDPEFEPQTTFTLPRSFGTVVTLQDRVFAPTHVFAHGTDYVLTENKITFTTPPFALIDGQWEPTLPGCAFRVLDGKPQLSLWAVDCAVDNYELYYQFGHFFSSKRVSSEAYRSFIRGVMQLYLLGPAVERVESALNVVAGLPVIRNDGEAFVSATLSPDGVEPHVVITDKHTYTFPPSIQLAPEVLGALPGKLFSVFQPMTTAVRVTDYLSDPSWWHNLTIPETYMPGATRSQRTVSPNLVETLIWAENDTTADRTGQTCIGDMGFVIGAGARQRHAFIVMDRFLKTHMFSVVFDQQLGELLSDMLVLLRGAKPTHTDCNIRTGWQFKDEIIQIGTNLLDTFTFAPSVTFLEDVIVDAPEWCIGDPGVNIADAFFYAPDGTPIITVPGFGSNSYIVGGLNPLRVMPAGSLMDLPLVATVLPPPPPDSFGGDYGFTAFGSQEFGGA